MPLHDLEQLVTYVDKDSAPRIIPFGEDFLLEDLPVGTRVIYPPQPFAALANVDAAIRHAVTHPLGMEPLHALLSPGMKVTIAVDDMSVSLPQMKTPDVRERVLAVVLQMLGDYGVDDVHIVIATGMNRRMTESEIKRMVGARVFKTYWPERLYNHDAEDPTGVVPIGGKVEVNARVAASDLVIDLGLSVLGNEEVRSGVSSYRTLQQTSSADVRRAIESRLKVFHIQAVLNNRVYDAQLDFLARNEDHFTDLEWLKFDALRFSLKHLPRAAKNRVAMKLPASYDVIQVAAGAGEAVQEQTRDKALQQNTVPVNGQCDILITGMPFFSAHNVNSILDPLVVQAQALGHLHNMHTGTPLCREGGTLIICHPCSDQFDAEQHPSSIEFFNRLLPETRDVATLQSKYENEFAQNPSYVDRFRFGHAYHGSHPFFMWARAEAGRRHYGRIIAAGADNSRVPELLGWERADSLQEAIAMARATAPANPEITLSHYAPTFISDVS